MESLSEMGCKWPHKDTFTSISVSSLSVGVASLWLTVVEPLLVESSALIRALLGRDESACLDMIEG